jgi:hypothetical protein
MSNDEHQPEVVFWRAVIAQAITDATFVVRKTKGTSVLTRAKDRDHARNWLLNNGPHFRLVCDMAALDAAVVRSAAKDLAEQGWPQITRGLQVGNFKSTAPGRKSLSNVGG